MKWDKKGFIYCPENVNCWMSYGFMTPCPIIVDSKTIRVFGGIRDKGGVSRVGFVDVCAFNPSIVKYLHEEPVLNIGNLGCFDDNGIILGSVMHDGNQWRMYYIGFQHVKNVKFYAFSGVAVSHDLVKFEKTSETPIMDRQDWMRYIGAIHTVIKDDLTYKVFYAAGNNWKNINGIDYPEYSVYYTESVDGYQFDFKNNYNIIECKNDQYRIGRPTCYKLSNGEYGMFCSYDTLDKQYGIQYFRSLDCVNWKKDDSYLKGLSVSKKGWDSEMVCYPAFIDAGEKKYLFYNGNGMGRTGFGYAELIET